MASVFGRPWRIKQGGKQLNQAEGKSKCDNSLDTKRYILASTVQLAQFQPPFNSYYYSINYFYYTSIFKNHCVVVMLHKDHSLAWWTSKCVSGRKDRCKKARGNCSQVPNRSVTEVSKGSNLRPVFTLVGHEIIEQRGRENNSSVVAYGSITSWGGLGGKTGPKKRPSPPVSQACTEPISPAQGLVCLDQEQPSSGQKQPEPADHRLTTTLLCWVGVGQGGSRLSSCWEICWLQWLISYWFPGTFFLVSDWPFSL